jgi:hypothetical protein
MGFGSDGTVWISSILIVDMKTLLIELPHPSSPSLPVERGSQHQWARFSLMSIAQMAAFQIEILLAYWLQGAEAALLVISIMGNREDRRGIML